MVKVELNQNSFQSRLNRLLDEAGYPRRGRNDLISRLSGLSTDGVKKLMARDTPPRQTTIDDLIKNLVLQLRREPIVVTPDQLRSYLLDGVELPVKDRALVGETASFFSLDPLYCADVTRLVYGIAEETQRGSFNVKVLHRVLKYCFKNRPDLSSSDLRTNIRELLELSEKGF